jgi:phosphopantothenate-cysteine ligase
LNSLQCFNLFISIIAIKQDKQTWRLGESDSASSAIVSAWTEYQKYRSSGLLHSVPFTTIAEYLNLLKALSIEVHASGLGKRVMLYCAGTASCSFFSCSNRIINALFQSAAVSDFYLPSSVQSTHKIQSGDIADADGHLHLSLPNTPKILKWIRSDWAPDAFLVSFKLETNDSILFSKAAGAVQKYGVHAVVANTLDARYREVFLISPTSGTSCGSSMLPVPEELSFIQAERISRPADGTELEFSLINRLSSMHDKFIQNV